MKKIIFLKFLEAKKEWFIIGVLIFFCFGWMMAQSNWGPSRISSLPIEAHYFAGDLDIHHDHFLERLLIWGYGVQRVQYSTLCDVGETAVVMIPKTFLAIPLGKDLVCYTSIYGNEKNHVLVLKKIITIERTF